MTETTFNVDQILDEAAEQSKLSDFGDPRFREGLEALAETFDRNLSTEETRAAERETLLRWLGTRLRIQEAFRRHPEILEQKIEAPMIVTGLPRSGTSALFNLLNADPDARALLLWEATLPDPFYGLEPGATDPRYEWLKEAMEANRDPEFEKIHYSTVDTPEECVLMHVNSLDGVLRGWEINLQPYNEWFRGHSLDFLYEEHLKHLKLLNWQRPGKRWLIKAPAHMWDMQALFKHFPDARIVWGHREPASVIASIASLQEKMMIRHRGELDEAGLKQFGETVMNWYAESLERGLAARAKLDPKQFVDYGFREFTDNPKAVIERIYSAFDLAIGPDTEQALAAHMADNQKGKHGKHSYDLAHYGLTESQVNERFAFYRDHPLI